MSVTSVVRRLKGLMWRVQIEEGQALVEYALLVALIALVAFGAVQAFGLGVSGLYSKINHAVP
jgi:pilus assembly protein Flp/PilA